MASPDELFAQPRKQAVEAEDLAAQSLEAARGKHEMDRLISAKVVEVIGLTPGVIDWLVASGRDVAAAELRFASAVENREALDKLIKELGEAAQG
jgi:hypothetical protein